MSMHSVHMCSSAPVLRKCVSTFNVSLCMHIHVTLCLSVCTRLSVLSGSVNYQHWVLFMFIITCFIVEYLSQRALAWLRL